MARFENIREIDPNLGGGMPDRSYALRYDEATVDAVH